MTVFQGHGMGHLSAARLLLRIMMLAAGGAAAAGDALRPGIIGEDDRTILEDQGPPFDAVGQVNIGGFRTSGQCTGTLVAPDRVVTAAHCVANPATGGPFPLGDIHFLAAVRGSQNQGHSTARCVRFPGDDPLAGSAATVARASGDRATLAALAKDLAVIVLNDVLDVEPAPLAADVVPTPGFALTHVAYPGDRRFLPVVHRNCRLIDADPSFWLNDCDTHPGSSGGPIFVRDDGSYKLAAILVAAGSGGANLALPLAAWANLVSDASCP
jgi:protease YdgD